MQKFRNIVCKICDDDDDDDDDHDDDDHDDDDHDHDHDDCSIDDDVCEGNDKYLAGRSVRIKITFFSLFTQINYKLRS